MESDNLEVAERDLFGRFIRFNEILGKGASKIVQWIRRGCLEHMQITDSLVSVQFMFLSCLVPSVLPIKLQAHTEVLQKAKSVVDETQLGKHFVSSQVAKMVVLAASIISKSGKECDMDALGE